VGVVNLYEKRGDQILNLHTIMGSLYVIVIVMSLQLASSFTSWSKFRIYTSQMAPSTLGQAGRADIENARGQVLAASTVSDGEDLLDSFCRGTNEAFKKLVFPSVREWAKIRPATNFSNDFEKMLSPPENPGIPRPVTMTILASVPTALGWYGFYKFSVEEELFHDELERTGKVTGCGGYGTLFPFVYALMIGTPMAIVPFGPIHNLGATIVEGGGLWILLSQLNLYRRVNELYEESGESAPLHPWWAILPPPLDVVVGLRQVHFLARYWSKRRGEENKKDYVSEELFPFIASPRFTLVQFAKEPRRWFWFTKGTEDLF
jgi:hypothetical protein